MDKLIHFFQSSAGQKVISTTLFLLVIGAILTVYSIVLKKVQKKAQEKNNATRCFIIDILRIPVLVFLCWAVFAIFSEHSFLSKTNFYPALVKINTVLLILSLGWILIKITHIVFFYLEGKMADAAENEESKKGLTKMKIFEGITVAIIVTITIAICLMSFDKIRSLGVSLLTSAGIAGIILGFAAQKSIGALFAGLQIAITQPIRLEDVVSINGNTGVVEEINLTYVVLRLSDESQSILPVSYFLDNPFQNLSRKSSRTTGSLLLYTDYNLPLKEIREQLTSITAKHPKWDQRVANLQVSDLRENSMELKIQLSSRNSTLNSDLLADVREELIRYIEQNHPDCWPKQRITDDLKNNTPS